MRNRNTFTFLLITVLLVCINSCSPDEEKQGLTIVVPGSDPFIPGATLDVPGNEVDDGLEYSITGISSVNLPESPNEILNDGTNTEKGSLFIALMDRSMNGEDVHLGHPYFGPIVGASKAEFTGPGIVLEPSGIQFNNPVTITVPLTALGITETDQAYEIIPLLQDGDGNLEIPEKFDIDFTEGTVTVEVTHFSILRWAKNYFTAISSPLQIYNQVNEAKEDLPIPEETMKEFLIDAILCANNSDLPLTLDKSSLPSMSDLLDGLALGSGPGSSGTVTNNLKNWLWNKYDSEITTGQEPQNFLKFSELFKESLSQSNGNVFKALANANGVLTVWRTSVKIDRTMENYRGDGNDETGARYHFFGAALQSFLYQHLKDEWYRDAPIPIIGSINKFTDPEFVVTVEEAIISGDIVSDTKEYAVDLNGIAFGKLLYEELFSIQQTREQLMNKYSIVENDLNCNKELVGKWIGSQLNVFNCTDPSDNETIIICVSGEPCWKFEFRENGSATQTLTVGSNTQTVDMTWQDIGNNSFKICSLDGSECQNLILTPPNKIVMELTYEGDNYCEASIDCYRE